MDRVYTMNKYQHILNQEQVSTQKIQTLNFNSFNVWLKLGHFSLNLRLPLLLLRVAPKKIHHTSQGATTSGSLTNTHSAYNSSSCNWRLHNWNHICKFCLKCAVMHPKQISVSIKDSQSPSCHSKFENRNEGMHILGAKLKTCNLLCIFKIYFQRLLTLLHALMSTLKINCQKNIYTCRNSLIHQWPLSSRHW